MGLSTKQVSSDVHGWNQSLLQASNLEYLPNNPMKRQQQQQQQEQQSNQQVLKCPRCESTNTKFCYYNNYNKSQPRHYCKACKRHWTKGGTLRNVPIGGGRKNKRRTSETASKTSSSTSKVASNTSMTIQGHQPPNLHMANNDENKLSDLQYPYSNLGNFIETTISSLHSPSTQVYYSSLEETIMMNNNNNMSISSWSIGEGPTSNSCNWDWDDFDKFASVDADLITIPWDDLEIKPW